MATKHFLLTNDGRIEEFSEEQAARVANGNDPLPEFADSRLRYVRVAYDDKETEDGELKVYTLGAIIGFDAEGHISQTESAESESRHLSHFEQDACVQFALRDTIPNRYVLN